MKTNTFILLFLVIFTIMAFFLDKSSYFQELHRSSQVREIPTAMLDRGPLGALMKKNGLIYQVKNRGDRYPFTQFSISDNSVPFQKKREVGPFLYSTKSSVESSSACSFPEYENITSILKTRKFSKDWIVYFLHVKKEDLYGEKEGIVKNFKKHGRAWERMGKLTVLKGDSIVFESNVGVRLQGGWSRAYGRNFRLFFRDEYGASCFNPDIKIFPKRNNPLSRLVIHRDPLDNWPFISCLAFDIARKIGCLTPDLKPSILFLNSKDYGIYYSCPHVGKKQWASRVGHDDFVFFRMKGENSKDDAVLYEYYASFLKRLCKKVKLTSDVAGRYIDLNNLSRYVIAMMFLAVTDAWQGAVFKDLSYADSKWQWVCWDLDGAFSLLKPMKHQLMENGLDKMGSLKFIESEGFFYQRVFAALLKEDPEFRNSFLKMLMDILNHDLKYSYLISRVNYYQTLSDNYGRKNLFCFKLLKDYFKYRPRNLLEDILKKLNNKRKIYSFKIDAPSNIHYTIDGYSESGTYNGIYIEGYNIVITPLEEGVVKYWTVNGKKVQEKDLELNVNKDYIIKYYGKN